MKNKKIWTLFLAMTVPAATGVIAASCDKTKNYEAELQQLASNITADVNNKETITSSEVNKEAIILTYNTEKLNVNIDSIQTGSGKVTVNLVVSLKEKNELKISKTIEITGFVDLEYSNDYLNSVIMNIEALCNEKANIELKDVTESNITFSNLNEKLYQIKDLSIEHLSKTNQLKVNYKIGYVKNDKQEFISREKSTLIDGFLISNEHINNLLNSSATSYTLIDVSTGMEAQPRTFEISYFAIDDGTFDLRLNNEEMFVPNNLEVLFKYDFDINNETFDGNNVKMKVSLKYNEYTTQEKDLLLNHNYLAGINKDFIEKYLHLTLDYTGKDEKIVTDFVVDQAITDADTIAKFAMKFRVNDQDIDATSYLAKWGLSITKITPVQINIENNNEVTFDVVITNDGTIGLPSEETYEFKINNFKAVPELSDDQINEFISKLKVETRLFSDEISSNLDKAILYYTESGQIDDNAVEVTDELLAQHGIKRYNKESIYSSTWNVETNKLETTINIWTSQSETPTVLQNDIITGGPQFEAYISELNIQIQNKETKTASDITYQDLGITIKANTALTTPHDFIIYLSIKTNIKSTEETELWKQGKKTLEFVFRNNITGQLYKYNKVIEGLKPYEEGNTEFDLKAQNNQLVSGTLAPEALVKIEELFTGATTDEYTNGYIKYVKETGGNIKLLFGPSKSKASNEFIGLTFDSDFLANFAASKLLLAKEHSRASGQKAFAITRERNEQGTFTYSIYFKLSDTQAIPYSVKLN
ncbi:lipoprotein [Metamycoplasma cloacale]|uniref:Uncharacterized protein n=1 Tax=Metamycoplasma cloacale TaxID=92401 RepID=A0A2Z4LLT5_9BACT|nr:hypothetical protein [Metamycoplasma cloacale]AWX42679.1 hypothetical protein DK849_01140 [Metamycoplasma cloacale]VEU79509.1 lipoprotein [Metamycoplasma cloacale]